MEEGIRGAVRVSCRQISALEDVGSHFQITWAARDTFRPYIDAVPVNGTEVSHIVNGDSEADETSLVWLLDIVDGSVRLELNPLDLLGVLLEEFIHVASIEANIYAAFEL